MLTTEQKINLLILAGFEPRCSHGHPRVVSGKGLLHRNRTTYTDWVYMPGSNWGYEYTLAEWCDAMIDTCPDEIIYKAIES